MPALRHLVIRPVETSEATEATQQLTRPQVVSPATPAAKTFASVLQDNAKTTASSSTSSPRPALPRIDAPEGETWQPISGHKDYARIISGPRKGQYINLTRGELRGQVFSIEQRDGKTVHVYGTGDAQKVIEAATDTPNPKRSGSAATAKESTPGKGEQWGPVTGHNNYADILSGSRNGLYVNISGGVRNGMAFQIVKRGDKTYHVYGSGKNRQVIEVGAKKAAAGTKSTDGTKTTGTDTSTSTTAANGGTASTTGAGGSSGSSGA